MARDPLRERWRREVFASTAITDATRVLLLLLLDDMDERGYVAVPRHVLAKRLNRNERKVSARFEDAVNARLLDRVVRGNKGVTAVYRAMVPDAHRLPVGGRLSTPKAAGSLHPSESENRHPMKEQRLPPGGPACSKAEEQTTVQPTTETVPSTSLIRSLAPETQEQEQRRNEAKQVRTRPSLRLVVAEPCKHDDPHPELCPFCQRDRKRKAS